MLCFPWKKSRQKNIKKYNKRQMKNKKDEEKCPKTKSIIEFDLTVSCSIKSLAVEKNSEINQQQNFLAVKCWCLLMFHWKVLFMILPKHFSSQTKKTKEIYNKHMIERIFPYSILTDTNSICVFFIFICKPESCTPDSNLEMCCLKLLLTVMFYIDLIIHTNFGRNIQSENLVIFQSKILTTLALLPLE